MLSFRVRTLRRSSISFPVKVTVISRAGSAALYSAFTSFSKDFTAARISFLLIFPLKRISALAFLGIALSRLPPSRLQRKYFPSPLSLCKRRARIRTAFARPSPILSPEWPPLRPLTESVTTMPVFSLRFAGRVHTNSAPPPQEAVMMPSFSESMLISLRLLSEERSIPAAPRRPTSSFTVNMHSRGGHLSESSSSSASMIATAIPSSPPRVVPSALSHTPSVTRVIGWVSMSRSRCSSFSQTMSTWPCRATGSASSKPAEPGREMIRFPSSSLIYSKPRSLAKFSR